MDLGPDNYELPGYFKEKRWTYYRLRTEGHNTLTIDKMNQNPIATAKIIDCNFEPRSSSKLKDKQNPYAIVDMSEAYRPQLGSVLRGIKLLENKELLLQDEISAPCAVSMQWHLHTAAKVSIDQDGRRAVLTQTGAKGEARVVVTIDAPADAVFRPEPAVAVTPAGQTQQPGVTAEPPF